LFLYSRTIYRWGFPIGTMNWGAVDSNNLDNAVPRTGYFTEGPPMNAEFAFNMYNE
jgi:hypothetical protein